MVFQLGSAQKIWVIWPLLSRLMVSRRVPFPALPVPDG